MNPDDATQLEAILDRNGIVETIDALGEIASLKAAHIMDNWQDESLAKAWERLATAIERFQRTKPVQVFSDRG